MAASIISVLILATSAVASSDCLRAAEDLIQQAPDFSKAHITTSHLYKRHIAQHFCEIAGNMTVVELGIFHGFTTSVLANMFRKVIAVDINTGLMKIASRNLGKLNRNVVFLYMDLMSDDWSKFDSNAVDVVVIDADHTYSGVRRDAESALRHFPDLQWMVFHDTWMEQIERAVGEFERDGILKCHDVGMGFDGSSYEYPHLDESEEKIIDVEIKNKPEGKICKRLTADMEKISPNFLDQLFYLYRQPIHELSICASGSLRFMPNGDVRSGFWRTGRGSETHFNHSQLRKRLAGRAVAGSWKYSQQKDVLVMKHPVLATEPLSVHFNRPRNAFLLAAPGDSESKWFGITGNAAHRPIHVASSLFL